MDRARLIYEISRRNLKIADVCQGIGISRSAFYRKCNGTSEFTLSEIQKIIEFLHLESPVGIFFSHEVS